MRRQGLSASADLVKIFSMLDIGVANV